MENEKLVDDAFESKAKDIEAIVAEIVKAEGGIEKHQAGIASLTAALIVALYRLGELLLSLSGAQGGLKQAKGAWLKKAVELCGTKSRVYMARDVANYFDNPQDSSTQKSGQTGEERAKAFPKPLCELEQLIRYKKDSEAATRKREREQQAAEAAKVVNRRESAVQGATARIVPPPDEEEKQDVRAVAASAKNDLAEARDVEPGAASVDYFAQLRQLREEATVQTDHDDEKEMQDVRAAVALNLVTLFDNDVQQAIGYLIESRWNKADALAWLTAWAGDEQAATKAAQKKPARGRKPTGRKRAADPQAAPTSATT